MLPTCSTAARARRRRQDEQETFAGREAPRAGLLSEQLVAQLAIAREASRSPELLALEEQLNANPDNLDLLEQIAVHYSAAGQYREALESLMHILRTDINYKDGATKKALLDTIASLGKGDPLAAEYQRKLFSLLY